MPQSIGPLVSGSVRQARSHRIDKGGKSYKADKQCHYQYVNCIFSRSTEALSIQSSKLGFLITLSFWCIRLTMKMIDKPSNSDETP